MKTIDPVYIDLAKSLLTRIDGETQDAAALIIAASFAMTVSEQRKPLLDVVGKCEVALRDAEECLPRWEILADTYKQLCSESVHSATVAAKNVLQNEPTP